MATQRVRNDPPDEPKTDTPPKAPDEQADQKAESALKADVPERTDPRAAEKLPPGMPQGFDPKGKRSKYRVLATVVTDDDGFEVKEGGIVELSDSLAKRYTSDSVTGNYGAHEGHRRALIEPYEEDEE